MNPKTQNNPNFIATSQLLESYGLALHSSILPPPPNPNPWDTMPLDEAIKTTKNALINHDLPTFILGVERVWKNDPQQAILLLAAFIKALSLCFPPQNKPPLPPHSNQHPTQTTTHPNENPTAGFIYHPAPGIIEARQPIIVPAHVIDRKALDGKGDLSECAPGSFPILTLGPGPKIKPPNTTSQNPPTRK